MITLEIFDQGVGVIDSELGNYRKFVGKELVDRTHGNLGVFRYIFYDKALYPFFHQQMPGRRQNLVEANLTAALDGPVPQPQ